MELMQLQGSSVVKHILAYKENENPIEVGYRYMFWKCGGCIRKEYKSLDVSIEDTKICDFLDAFIKKSSMELKCPKFPIIGKLEDGYFKTDREGLAVEVESVDKAKTMINTIYRDLCEWEKKLNVVKRELEDISYTLKRKLKAEGISYYSDEYRLHEDDLSIQFRFLGGMRAWSGSDEDICDADVLDRGVGKKISLIVESINKELKGKDLEMSWNTGEKAWTYFNLTIVSEFKLF